MTKLKALLHAWSYRCHYWCPTWQFLDPFWYQFSTVQEYNSVLKFEHYFWTVSLLTNSSKLHLWRPARPFSRNLNLKIYFCATLSWSRGWQSLEKVLEPRQPPFHAAGQPRFQSRFLRDIFPLNCSSTHSLYYFCEQQIRVLNSLLTWYLFWIQQFSFWTILKI